MNKTSFNRKDVYKDIYLTTYLLKYHQSTLVIYSPLKMQLNDRQVYNPEQKITNILQCSSSPLNSTWPKVNTLSSVLN